MYKSEGCVNGFTLINFKPPLGKPNFHGVKDKNICDKNPLPLGLGDDSGLMNEMSSEKVLSLIMPPREWEKDGVTRRQKISSQPATKTEVKQLGINLDNSLVSW
ncbi:Axonemal dynein light chain [Cinara cedri]|uniref:Axonemal dynein light chain n=1 Tax=Cinara cedri TaxID=506608 RepID=A0A5E4N376_9HEMI|nr:Axonemal dynein light chain [Cinara cedri]